MPHPFLIASQSDYLIQIVDINSHTEWQTVQIQISWLLQKPTDQDLLWLQKQGISGFSRTRVKTGSIWLQLWTYASFISTSLPVIPFLHSQTYPSYLAMPFLTVLDLYSPRHWVVCYLSSSWKLLFVSVMLLLSTGNLTVTYLNPSPAESRYTLS